MSVNGVNDLIYMKVLAIESTCDETGAALLRSSSYEGQAGVEVLSNVVASSAEIHTKYGGVVPEVASREQVKSIIPVIQESLLLALNSKSQATKNKQILNSNDQISRWARKNIDAIAVAVGPGLIGSLLIGVETAKTLALAWNKPLIPVNHMTAHVMANWIGQKPELPAVALVVSGGHTDLVYLKTLTDWEWVGGTRDDAAGECFDKTARLLGLGYPGGPAIEKASEQADPVLRSHPSLRKGNDLLDSRFRLPRPMIHEDNLEMSFSGLKSGLQQLTAPQTAYAGGQVSEETRNMLAREVNEAVVEVLVSKTMRAVERYAPKSVLLAGGVAANSLLREQLANGLQTIDIGFYVPEFRYCTDNAAMIGVSALLRDFRSQIIDHREILKVRPEPGLETV